MYARRAFRHRVAFFGLFLTAAIALNSAGPVMAASTSMPESERLRHDERWSLLRTSLFPDQVPVEQDDVFTISAPIVPKDPAVVPVTIKSLIPQTPQRYIKKITLLIDHNPAPLAAVFHLTERSGQAHLKTRVRVNEFSYIRAIAETSDGQLHMSKAFVKASGGCDVPPRVDGDSVLSRLGNMKLRLPGGAKRGEVGTAHLIIDHPNYNGMQVGNTAGVYIPARILQKIEVTYADSPLLTIDGHLSMSEDPQFRFHYVPDGAGELAVRLVDSDKTQFQNSWSVNVDESQDTTHQSNQRQEMVIKSE